MVLLGLQDFTPTPEVPLASPGPKSGSLLGIRKVELPALIPLVIYAKEKLELMS